MKTHDSLTVAWPPMPLGEPGWRTRLECLATRAEGLIGKHCRLSDTAGIALELVGLLWPVLGAPETVAATCRASLLLGAPGVLMATAPADQVQEIAARLDAIWEAAQNDPAAGVVELPQPVMNEIRPVPAELAEPPAVIEVIDALVEPAPAEDPDELPEAWRPVPEPQQRPIEDEPEVVWLKSDELAAALGVSQATITLCQRQGLFDSEGLTRRPHPGEGRGRRFALDQCRETYLARPSRRNRKRPKAPTPLPVTIEPLPPAVEPGESEAVAAALLELAGGDDATLAALRELLGCAPV